ncbi:SPFH domain-containing protein [Streptomyces sp. NPDC005791]
MTENVRGEWDELGARDTRVLLPGPGVGDPGPPVADPEPEKEPAVPAVAAPAVAAPGVEVSAVELEDDIPADLWPAMDAVAVVGPTAPAAGGGLVDLDLDLGLSPEPEGLHFSPEPEPEPEDPHLWPEPEPEPEPDPEDLHLWPEPEDLDPGPARAPAALRPDLRSTPEPAQEAVAGVLPEAKHVPAGRRARPGDGPPDLRKSLPGGSRPADPDVERPLAALHVGAVDPVAWSKAGRRQPVVATENTAPAPVHLLFRDDDDHDHDHGHGDHDHGDHDSGDGHDGEAVGTDATAAGAGVVRRPTDRRPSLPPSPRVQSPTRPAPLADPRLTERPGPALPGWSALCTTATAAVAALAVLGWHGVLPASLTGRFGLGARPYDGVGIGAWALLTLLAAVALFALCGLGRGRVGHVSVLTLFGDYRGSVRRTGLLWISPLLRRRRIDVRLRHWRSESLPAVDANGTALRAVVLVVWRVKDTARATLGVADHERYLCDQVEAALARVLSQLPADAFHEDARTLRDAEAVGDALTRMVRADCAPVGIEVYSAQPTAIEYAPEVAAAMQRCRVAAIDAKHRDGVLTSVVDAVDDTVGRLTARGIVELDAYEHKALVRDLTVAFYVGRSGGETV